MMNEDVPYKFSELAHLMQGTHDLYHQALKPGSGKKSLWQEIEDSFARMFKMVSTQVPLIQAKFEKQLTECKNARASLKEQNEQLAEDLRNCQGKLSLDKVAPTTSVNDEELRSENDTLRSQFMELQRKYSRLQLDLQAAEKVIAENEKYDGDCEAQLSELSNENRELRERTQQLEEKIAQLIQQQEGSLVSIADSEDTFSGGQRQQQGQPFQRPRAPVYKK